MKKAHRFNQRAVILENRAEPGKEFFEELFGSVVFFGVLLFLVILIAAL